MVKGSGIVLAVAWVHSAVQEHLHTAGVAQTTTTKGSWGRTDTYWTSTRWQTLNQHFVHTAHSPVFQNSETCVFPNLQMSSLKLRDYVAGRTENWRQECLTPSRVTPLSRHTTAGKGQSAGEANVTISSVLSQEWHLIIVCYLELVIIFAGKVEVYLRNSFLNN